NTPKEPLPLPYSKKEELYIPREETMWENNNKKLVGQKKKLPQKIFLVILLIILISTFSYACFFVWKTYLATKKMNGTDKQQQTTFIQNMRSMIAPIISNDDLYALRGQETGRINILLLGAAGENQPGGNLTDTVMIMSIDTKNKKLALLSLPRDFYVPIPSEQLSQNSQQTTGQSFAKINSLYKIGTNQQAGTELIQKAVENITGVQIHYHVVVDFAAFEKIIDNIGGVNVMVQRDIYDPKYPGPNYSYQTFSLTKGSHLLDGQTALKYVRERHNDPEGDFGRAKRQQQVIQAVKTKLFSLQTLFNATALSKILDTLGNNVKTDISFNDIEQFIKLSRTLDTQNINNVVVDAWKQKSLLKVSHVMTGNDRAFILIPRVGNYSEIEDLARNIFDQAELKKRHDSIVEEEATISIVNQSGNKDLATKIKKLLNEKLEFKNVKIISDTNDMLTANSTISTNEVGAKKIFTLDELIKKLPASLTEKSTTSETTSESDITITLGNDLISIYKYEEDTIEDFNKAQENQLNF
ncbi:MAG: hypothetical protein US25_C0021G0008, partial [Candidatus Moranbacteria bacterium GW2011_GWE1_36_7]